MVSIDPRHPRCKGLDLVKMPWKPVSDDQKAKVACILDEVCVLNIPKPQTPQEEEELVNRFLDGMRKLFSKENNWTFLPMLETSMDYCAQCNNPVPTLAICTRCPATTRCTVPTTALKSSAASGAYVKKEPRQMVVTVTWA